MSTVSQDDDDYSASTTPAPRFSSTLHKVGSSSRKPGRRPKAAALKDPSKRRCISTACIACRKRKSKCDGQLPSCAACALVYATDCVYDPASDHRRRGTVAKASASRLLDGRKRHNENSPRPPLMESADSADSATTARNDSPLEILMRAVLNADEDEAYALVHEMRNTSDLKALAERVSNRDDQMLPDQPEPADEESEMQDLFRTLQLENGISRHIGGTSHLIYKGDSPTTEEDDVAAYRSGATSSAASEIWTSWTEVTDDPDLISHLLSLYFNYHYAYFTTLSKRLFWRDFSRGGRRSSGRRIVHCSSLLVNAMLALGCHFTDIPEACAIPGDTSTKGDHFFNEAKRILFENDEYEKPRLVTVQALALMSVREAGCGREARGWVFSGMSFRMAQDMGLNLGAGNARKKENQNQQQKHYLSHEEVDARRITFWGCFLFDKCWSNYLGRFPQLHKNSFKVGYIDIFPEEEEELWAPFTAEQGFDQSRQQPSRTRGIAVQLFKLCEISSDLLVFFYHPTPQNDKAPTNSRMREIGKMEEVYQRLEDWREQLPKELEVREDSLPSLLLVHMFSHLQYIHLFRPFLRYHQTSVSSPTPLPPHISPRQLCTTHADAIAHLMRLYRRTWGVRQICNIAIYMIHIACIIHLLNLPHDEAKRNLIDGLTDLEEIGEDWLSARRTLRIIGKLAAQWERELPEEAMMVLRRSTEKFGEGHGRRARTGSGSLGGSHVTNGTAATTEPDMSPSSSSSLDETLGSYSSQEGGNLAPQWENGNSPSGVASYPPTSRPLSLEQYPGNNSQSSAPQPSLQSLYQIPYGATNLSPTGNGGAVHGMPGGPFPDMPLGFSPQSMDVVVDNPEWFLSGPTNLQQDFGQWHAQ